MLQGFRFMYGLKYKAEHPRPSSPAKRTLRPAPCYLGPGGVLGGPLGSGVWSALLNMGPGRIKPRVPKETAVFIITKATAGSVELAGVGGGAPRPEPPTIHPPTPHHSIKVVVHG